MSGTSGYEKRDTSAKPIFIAFGIGVVLIVIFLVALDQLFISTKEEMIYKYEMTPVSEQLLELRANEKQVLESYALLDTAKSIYQIPIESAMEIVVKEHQNIPK